MSPTSHSWQIWELIERQRRTAPQFATSGQPATYEDFSALAPVEGGFNLREQLVQMRNAGYLTYESGAEDHIESIAVTAKGQADILDVGIERGLRDRSWEVGGEG